jgi:hypothetical protein
VPIAVIMIELFIFCPRPRLGARALIFAGIPSQGWLRRSSVTWLIYRRRLASRRAVGFLARHPAGVSVEYGPVVA